MLPDAANNSRSRRERMKKNNRLKAARVLRGMTQLQLAERVGVREIGISRLETGRARPDPRVKELLAAVLHKPPHELFDE